MVNSKYYRSEDFHNRCRKRLIELDNIFETNGKFNKDEWDEYRLTKEVLKE